MVAAVAEGGCFVLLDRVGPRGLPASEQTTKIGTNLFKKPLQTYIVWSSSAPLMLDVVLPTHQNKQKFAHNMVRKQLSVSPAGVQGDIFKAVMCEPRNIALITNSTTNQQQQQKKKTLHTHTRTQTYTKKRHVHYMRWVVCLRCQANVH